MPTWQPKNTIRVASHNLRRSSLSLLSNDHRPFKHRRTLSTMARHHHTARHKIRDLIRSRRHSDILLVSQATSHQV